MKKIYLLISLSLIVLTFSSLYSKNKLIKMKNLEVEFLTANVQLTRLKLLSTGITKYLYGSTDFESKWIKNAYIKPKYNDSQKELFKVYVEKYRANEKIIFRVLRGKDRTGKYITIWLNRWHVEDRKNSPAELKLRNRISHFFIREGLTKKEAVDYLYYAKLISIAIDKAVERYDY